MNSTLPEQRRQLIIEKLNSDGEVIATELSTLLNVSEDTIRRDLRVLAEASLLQRVHGGALPLSPSVSSYAVRKQETTSAKTDVARAAARLLTAGQVILFDGGTTIQEVARQLPPDLKATAITTSPHIAVTLTAHPYIEVIMVGGQLDKHSMTVLGASALESIQMLQIDVCLFGVCSLHPEMGITAASFEEIHLKRAMLKAASDVMAVVTADKFGTAAPYTIAPINQLTHLITERSVADKALMPYREAGLEIVQG